MSSPGFNVEQSIMDTIVPELEADGYRVVMHPLKESLPAFLSGIQPDMVAYKGDQKLAIEILSQRRPSNSREQHLRKIFMEHSDWALRLVYAPPITSEASLPVLAKHVISQHLTRIEASIETMGLTAALLMGWAAFEAAARALLPSDFRLPQPPARLIEALAFEGYVTPDEADVLWRLSSMRTEVAHGSLDLVPALGDVRRLLNTTRLLLELDEADTTA